MDQSFEDRMKLYEGAEAGRRLMPLLPVLARIDGRRFSRFTADLARPYDERLSRLMVATTHALVREANARIGYTQSDEITLVMHSDQHESQVYFDGRVQKMVSHLAAHATAVFNLLLPEYLPEKAARRTVAALPSFDCRVWNVPSLTEAVNVLVWRESDATRNSLSMATRALYSHAEMHDKNAAQMHEMLFARGVNWNDYPAFFKRGTYVQRRTVTRRFTPAELEALPPRHAARENPALEIERTEYAAVEMPPIVRVVNREGVVFRGEAPRVAADGDGSSAARGDDEGATA